MSAANGWDDLWIAVICQTSPEIAGSPRNIFRYSLKVSLAGVEHCLDIGDLSLIFRQTPNTAKIYLGVSAWGLSSRC